jgi:hypothetical protein
MLILRRNEGQWIEVVHRETGELLRIQVRNLHRGRRWVELVFDDSSRRFGIARPPDGPEPTLLCIA